MAGYARIVTGVVTQKSDGASSPLAIATSSFTHLLSMMLLTLAR